MNRNVEIKAKVTDLEAIERRARTLADEGPLVLDQEDTFFVCGHGRLKLRRFVGTAEAELIYYERPASTGPTQSNYLIYRTSEPDQIGAVLTASLCVRGVVRKRRTLYLIGPTRVHLDRVDGLGDYVELEVVRQPHETTSQGMAIANDLMDKLGIPRKGLLDKAYIDLLLQ
jgi:adenylate cyclase class IV